MPRSPSSPGPTTLLRRAVTLRCPACGGGSLFVSWFRIRDRCGRCGLRTARGEAGYVVGAYMFNILMAELIWVGIGVGLVLTSWPNPPWDLLLYGGGALMIVLPFLLYPVAKALFLAFDLIFRPPEDTEPNE